MASGSQNLTSYQANKWTNLRAFTIGDTAKNVDGTAAVSWTATEILGSSDDTKFYRGDKTWSNTLTGAFFANNITSYATQYIINKTIDLSTNNNGVSSETYTAYDGKDKNEKVFFAVEGIAQSGGNVGAGLFIRNYSGNTAKSWNGLIIYADKDGNCWMTMPHRITTAVYINVSTDVTGTGDAGSLIIGNKASTNLGLDDNEIMARNNKNTSTLNLNIDNSTDGDHLASVAIGSTNDTSAQCHVRYSTASSSTTTGALRVNGGVGIGGKIYVGNNAFIQGTVIINVGGTSVDITQSNNAAATNGMTSNQSRVLQWNDANGKYIGRIYSRADTDGSCHILLHAGNWYGDTPAQKYKGIDIKLTKTGGFSCLIEGATTVSGTITGTYLYSKHGTIDIAQSNNNLSTNTGYGFYGLDKNGKDYTRLLSYALTSGETRLYLQVRNHSGSAYTTYGGIIIKAVKTSNDINYEVSNPANFRSAISAPSTTGDGASGTWGISITGNAATADKWKTKRTLTIGGTGKDVDGSGNVSWSATEILGSSDSTKFYRGDKTWSSRLTGGLDAAYLGITNTTSTNGYGISLYNGATAGAPTYGIMFAGTATFGKLGDVSSDWATYLTMSDTVTRGWVFRRGSTNVASISGHGILTLSGTTNNGMAHDSSNPKITFVDSGTTQPVHIIYTDLDSYRAPAGLKIVGGASATPAWLEVEGDIHARALNLYPGEGSYREGIRIHSYSSWSDITLCGNDNTGASGTSANSWFIGNNNGNFHITRNGSSGDGSAYLRCVSNVWAWNGTANGSISGNAATATRLQAPDSRSTNESPSTLMGWGRGITTAFKQRSTVGTPDGSGTYGIIINLTPWGDSSGSRPKQLWVDDGSMSIRYGNSDSGWSGWSRFVTNSGTWSINVTGSSGSCTGNAATATTASSCSGNALTCSYPAGFVSRSTGTTWGNTTGTCLTTWNTTNGGSIDFRYDNPSSGKLSVKVDGRFYGNEGTYPTMLMNYTNNYWGMGDPDAGSSVWIRTTSLGIIPYQSGGAGSGHCGLGTSSWYFSYAYIDSIYGTIIGHYKSTNNAGWQTDQYGSIKHQRSTNTDYLSVLNSGGTEKIRMYYETGELDIAGNLYLITAGTHIRMKYSSTNYSVLYNHNNGNVSINAASAGLYVGYFQTTGIYFHTGGNTTTGGTERGKVDNNGVKGAVWNDFAEFRKSYYKEPGRVVVDLGNGWMDLCNERLAPGAKIISDTYGMSVGYSLEQDTPIGVGGRVLVYPYQDKSNYHVGDCVCSAPDGTVDIMTREEIIHYPERILGTVSEIPNYEVWSQQATKESQAIEVKTNGRIWIYVK